MFAGRNRWVRRVLFAVAMFWSIAVAVGSAQTGYAYTVIEEPTNCSSISAPVLNKNGEVAFWADCNNAIVVRRGDGGTLVEIHSYTRGYRDTCPVT